MRWFCSRILVLALSSATPAFADDGVSTEGNGPPSPEESDALSPVGLPRSFDAPRIDYPPLQGLALGVSLYVDHTYETTNDLSTFWWVTGRGRNDRVAVGGLFQFGNFRFNAEVPMQYTQLSIDSLMEVAPTDADRSKAAFSLGDVSTGVAYLWDLQIAAAKTYLGLGLRVRWPTHTTKFRFGLMDGSTIEFGFPYYLHLAPAALLSTTLGPVSLTLNEGVLAMVAKDVWIGDILQPIPNVYFWESHAAIDLAATDWLDFSIEVLTCVQLNQVTVSNMSNLNDTRAVFITPGVTIDAGNYRLILAGRFGLPGRGSRDFGVITFSGANAYLARLSYMF